MSDNQASKNQSLNNQALNGILGAVIAVALAIFLLSGGEHFGKTTVHGDADLPPVATMK
jgi:hypothetical protein